VAHVLGMHSFKLQEIVFRVKLMATFSNISFLTMWQRFKGGGKNYFGGLGFVTERDSGGIKSLNVRYILHGQPLKLLNLYFSIMNHLSCFSADVRFVRHYLKSFEYKPMSL